MRYSRGSDSAALALPHTSRRSLGRVLRKVANVGMRLRAVVPRRVGRAARLEPFATKIKHAVPTDRGACMQDGRGGYCKVLIVPVRAHDTGEVMDCW